MVLEPQKAFDRTKSYFFPVHSGRATKAYSQYSKMCETTTLRTVKVMVWREILQREIEE